MNTPFFSVIIPVYNLEQYVHETLDSVIDQTFSDFECVCVDDGSEDRSVVILDEYAQKDSRIKVIHQTNGGEGAARNAGLQAAIGKWILLLDGDDLWHPQLMEFCVRAISQGGDVDAIRFETQDFTDGDTWSPKKVEFDDLLISDYSCVTPLNELLASGPFSGHAYRAEIIRSVCQKSLCVGTDRDGYFQCLLKMRNVRFLQGSPLYGYRRRQGSAIMSKITLRKMIDEILWRFGCIADWLDAGRTIESCYARCVAIGLTESISAMLVQIAPAERAVAWRYWLAGMRRLKLEAIFYGWWRISVKICLRTGSAGLFMLLYYIPYRLKRFGLHR